MKDTDIQILLVDDHTVVLDGLSSLLNAEPGLKVVFAASSGKEALQQVSACHPHLVITDLNMPEMNGFELTRQIRRIAPDLPVIALSMHSDGKLISRFISEGIQGYLLKETGREELVQAIRTVAAGGTWFPEEVRKMIFEQVASPSTQPPIEAGGFTLTERETEILEGIAEELTQEEIAEKLYISTHTVVYQRRKLLDKFQVKNTAGLIRKAIRMGYLD